MTCALGLQNVAIELISARGTQALYEQILDTATAILHADFATIQKFYPDRGANGELQLMGYRGFTAEAAKSWEWIGSTRSTSCGEALRTGRRVAVPDVRTCNFMSGTGDLEEYLRAGIFAVQSTPLISRSGALLGVVSTHWRASERHVRERGPRHGLSGAACRRFNRAFVGGGQTQRE